MKKANNPDFVKVYEDLKGNVWYSHKNPLTISAIRGIAAERANRYVGMMISEKELKKLLQEHNLAAKEFDVVKCFAIVQQISYRMEFITEENSVLDLVSLYYMLEDEPIEELTDAFAEKKKEIFNTDPVTKGFFLRLGFVLTNKLANIPESDLLKSLEKTKEVADQIYMFIKR